jgi:hypothetical protein
MKTFKDSLERTKPKYDINQDKRKVCQAWWLTPIIPAI